MSLIVRLNILSEIFRVNNLDEDDIEYSDIYDYEREGDESEPRVYALRKYTKNNITNRKFIMNVIKLTSIHSLQYFRHLLFDIKNEDDVLYICELLKIDPKVLYNLPIKILENYTIANDLSCYYGGILEFLFKFRKNENIVKNCYKNHISCLNYAHDVLLDNEDFMLEACIYNIKALEYITHRLTKNELFFEKLIEKCPKQIDEILHYCSEEICEKYIEKSSQSLKSIDFYRLFQGKQEMHRAVPIHINIKNKIRRKIYDQNMKYNHQLDYVNESYLMYNYY